MTTRLRMGLVSASVVLSLAAAACSTTPKAAPAPGSSAPIATDPLTQYRAWIGEARVRHPYPESAQRMFDVMMCESGGRPKVVNKAGPYTGLFQYATGTWNGAWNTYRNENILEARSQIFATALAWSKGMQSHWGCFKKTT